MKDERERREYIRNVVIIARSDGEVSTQERIWLARIQTAIGAAPESVQEALNTFGEPEVNFSGIFRFSDRVRCVEDMVIVAICDGQLDPGERLVLVQAAREAGLSQSQIDLIVQEAQKRER